MIRAGLIWLALTGIAAAEPCPEIAEGQRIAVGFTDGTVRVVEALPEQRSAVYRVAPGGRVLSMQVLVMGIFFEAEHRGGAVQRITEWTPDPREALPLRPGMRLAFRAATRVPPAEEPGEAVPVTLAVTGEVPLALANGCDYRALQIVETAGGTTRHGYAIPALRLGFPGPEAGFGPGALETVPRPRIIQPLPPG